jgi:type II secretory pathway pseudopilin PulG
VAKSEAGFSLVAAAASITVMLLMMSVAVPSWRYVMQNAREEELIFRGAQITDAIERYQKKHGNAPPVSLDVLVKGRFLRKAYKDPMTPDGKWRFIRPGEAVGVPVPGAPGGVPLPGQPGQPTPSPGPTSRPGRTGTTSSAQTGGAAIGPFIGVASFSQEKSLRVFNGRTRYDQWLFVVGQPRLIGKDAALRLPPGVRPVNPSPRR